MAPGRRAPSPYRALLHHEARQPPRSSRALMVAAGGFICLACAACLLFTLAAGQPAPQPASSATQPNNNNDIESFVRVAGGQFVVGPTCKRFLMTGWNQWEMVEAGAGALELFGASLPANTTGPALLRRVLDRAAANGFTVLRTWAHTVTAQYALQTSPGEYNEAVFRGLDYALDEARKRGIRLLLSLTDNWQQTGGADEFVRWAGGRAHEDFFSSPAIKQLYKNHVAAVLGRVNSINGRKYTEDPTIFGWNLINEPRCYKCGTMLEGWVKEMAAYVKALDPNHLLTVGEEGFYPAGLPQSAANPQGSKSWANTEGQNFVADHALPDIDFMAIHLWINNWEDKSPDFVRRWVQQHIDDAKAAGKPLVMEEFGVWDGVKEEQLQYYSLVYDLIAQSVRAGGPAAGALFWTFYAEGQRAPAEEGGTASGLFGVFESDGALWPVVRGFGDAMRSLSGPAASSCPPAAQPAVRPAADCSATRISGREGTGKEGARCNQDINECARGTSGCDPNAGCVDSASGYTCTCFEGYSGDGFSCQPTPTLQAMQSNYETDGAGRLACNEGKDLPWPEGAPGFAYDVTGALGRVANGGQQNGLGSRTAVEPLGCMAACNWAPGCDSFAYNPAQHKCFLKAGATRRTCGAAETVCVSARGSPYSCGTWQTYFRKANGNATVPLVDGSTPPASVQLVEAFAQP